MIYEQPILISSKSGIYKIEYLYGSTKEILSISLTFPHKIKKNMETTNALWGFVSLDHKGEFCLYSHLLDEYDGLKTFRSSAKRYSNYLKLLLDIAKYKIEIDEKPLLIFMEKLKEANLPIH